MTRNYQNSMDLQQKLDECKRRNTALRKSLTSLTHKCEKLDTILEALPHPFAVINAADYTVTLANRAALTMTGEAGNLTCHELTHKRSTPCNSGQHPCPLEIVKKTGEPATVEHIHYDADGNPRYVQIHGYPIFDRQGNVVEMVEFSLDITDRKETEQQLVHMANHDPLTGLPNRNLFLERLNLELKHAKRKKKKVAVLLIDLDDFKEVNDTLGHTAGDRLLINVGRIFSNLLRESDTVARMGGDEFLLLLPDLESGNYAYTLTEKIFGALQQPVQPEGWEGTVRASIGGTVYPDDSDSPENLIRFADIAMYRVKEKGGNSFQMYSSSETCGE